MVFVVNSDLGEGLGIVLSFVPAFVPHIHNVMFVLAFSATTGYPL